MGKSIIDLSSVTTVGLDLAKHVFQVHGVDASGRVIVAKALRRKDVLAFFAQLPACLALPFLGAALLGFRDFMERVDIVWAPLVRGAGIDARTTQSPAHREASPECLTGWPCPPAGTHTNASFAAEVQSNSDAAKTHKTASPDRPAVVPSNRSLPMTQHIEGGTVWCGAALFSVKSFPKAHGLVCAVSAPT